ncbi:MAG TPA: GGDEF domain-containing protein, partial [Luteimonas sp.]|nr:GGDEF domain-containing protein [Luteimonas sp.]
NSRLMIVLLLMLVAMIATWAYKTKRMQVSLRQMAETDALTGICNRHHFTQRAEAALAAALRDREEVALVMFDLDHFKAINDRYGHAVGDWVLRAVAATCRPLCRGVDCFGRIGGEEFAILMIGCDERVARRLADDCRVRLAGLDTRESGQSFQVTASFGISTTRESGHDLARLLSHADKVLYSAKHAGRNQVAVYRPTAATALPVMLRSEGVDLHLVREQPIDGALPRVAAL